MEEAIKHYMDIVRDKGINIYHFPVSRRLSNVDPELMRHFDAGEIFVARHEHSDFEIFNREIGYPLPKDIADYLNPESVKSTFIIVQQKREQFLQLKKAA